jgi:carbamate kinase
MHDDAFRGTLSDGTSRTPGFVPKIAVVAFGGNALLPKESDGTQEEQKLLAREASTWLADIVKRATSRDVGNGPQVGNILIQVEQSVP